MLKYFISILVILLLAGAMFNGCSGWGRSLDEKIWDLRMKLEDENPQVREEALLAIGRYGLDAKSLSEKIYTVVKEEEVLYVRATATWANERINAGLINYTKRFNFHKFFYRHYDLVDYLGVDKHDAEQVILEKLVDDDVHVRLSAAFCLFLLDDIPATAIPPLINALDDEDVRMRYWSAGLLSLLGPEAKDAVPALAKTLKGNDYAVGIRAADAIERINANPDVAIPALIQVIENDENYMKFRAAAAKAIGGYGSDASMAIPALTHLIESSTGELKMRAGEALGKVSPDSDIAIDAIVAAFNDPDSYVRFCAVHALGDLGPTNMVIEALINALEHTNTEVVGVAAFKLGEMGPVAEAARPQLMELALNKHLKISINVIEALGGLGYHSETAELLISIIKSMDDPYSLETTVTLTDSCKYGTAVTALGKMGPQVVPHLERLLNEEADHLRQSAILALGDVGKDAAAVVPTLLEILNDKDFDCRWGVTQALGKISSEPVVIDVLIKTLNDSDELVRMWTVISLGEIGPPAKDAIPYLIKALDDEYGMVVRSAAKALGKMGPLARDALPKLKELASEISEDDRYHYLVFKNAIKEIEG